MTDLTRIRHLAGLSTPGSSTPGSSTPGSPTPGDARTSKAAACRRARSLVPVLTDRIEGLFGSDRVGPRLIVHIFTRYIEAAIRHDAVGDDDLRTIMDRTMKLVRLYHSGKDGRVEVAKLAAQPD